MNLPRNLRPCLALYLRCAAAPAQLFAPIPDVVVGGTPNFVAVGDLNGDGRLDVASANGTTGVGIVFGNGAGGASATTSIAVANPGSVAIADVDGDGKQDLVTTAWAG